MTREELKEHCKRQVEAFEMWAKHKSEELNNSKIYQEHKLILELLEQETVSKEVYDHEYFLRKEFEIKIAQLEQQIARLEQQEPILDKIRAEILEISSYEGFELGGVKDGYRIAMVNVLDIIDKYKAESENT